MALKQHDKYYKPMSILASNAIKKIQLPLMAIFHIRPHPLVLGLRGNTGFLWYFKTGYRGKRVLHTGSTPLVCV